MTIEVLAADDTAYQLGRLVGALLFPGLGLFLLVLGLVMRARGKNAAPPPQPWSTAPGSYPPPPGHYPPPGYPQAPGYPPPGPPPPAKSSGGATALIVIGCVLLVLSLVSIVGRAALRTGTSTSDRSINSSRGLSVGDCITDAQYSARDMDPTPVPCSTPEAIFSLAYRGEGPTATCPDGLRDGSKYAVLVNTSVIYCFALDVTVGECFAVDGTSGHFRSVACTDPTANAKVDQILEGQTDLSACPAGPSGSAVPVPPRVVCTVKP